MDPEHTLKISFDEDIYAFHEHYRPRSKSSNLPQLLPSDEPDYLVTETEIGDSYLSATLSTIQPLNDHKSILILTIVCHPAPSRRFVNATVTWKVSLWQAAPLPNDIASSTITSSAKSQFQSQLTTQTTHVSIPKIVVLSPQHSLGGWTEEQTRLLFGISVPVNAGFPGGSVGVQPSAEKETQKAVIHAMTILGSIRDNGTKAHWTIEENKSSERGIPSHFQLAMVVDHTALFVSELDVKAELGGGLWPSFLKAKKGKDGNGLKKVIDVEKWKCGEVLWEPGEQGWRQYVASLSGEVPGAVLDFHQAIARP